MSSGGTKVYVGGLIEGIKKEDLEREFDKYGKLNSVWVALNPPGFAFIEFENSQEAEDACSAMNGTELLGATLRVELSRRREGPRRGGSFRGNGGSNFRGRSFDGGYRGRGGSFGGGRPYNNRRGGGGGGYGGSGGFRSRSPHDRY
ncbi:RNA-binding protein Rsf1 [Eumeta japonica]|uniref:RNA-binding protein Rsf1 n=1 Tax=Eumeta variegata TaxID=151549 RepID=A0A4C1S7K5_EUMVA|nr:RNA-binding protein Rsf1 [Eumeta japonica]